MVVGGARLDLAFAVVHELRGRQGMAIESFEGGTMITGEHISLYVAVTTASSLALEINTGLRSSRGSTMLVANRITVQLDHQQITEMTGVKVPKLGVKRTKRGALEDLALYLMLVWNWELSPKGGVYNALGEARALKVTRKAARVLAKLPVQVSE